ncbi:BbrUII/HgiDII family restriction enzyme [Phocoenobacter skyensis]|uniref:BbrUII/HgiDII family restriction enzyme n=1 Tax=Phocoenobacter skyensis TaxID=97481 RepID=UPI002773F024|nr:ATP-binding protein [Pasteurella skyensis]MDP8185328.1 ATP-binding protein [Pasteurella skyensis]
MKSYKFNIDLNVLNHLGLSLYTNTPAVLTEIVSNAWDADATEVRININTDKNTITIFDNGHGMDSDDIEHKFLNVGYARRKDNRDKSPIYNRQVMGRKGIGKLAMFSLANIVEVYSQKKDSTQVALKIDVLKLQEAIRNGGDYETEQVRQKLEDIEVGTKIELSDIHKHINKTVPYLKKHLSRRFSIIGEQFNFKVFLNDHEITLEDRGYTSKLEFLWCFDNETQEKLAGNISKQATLNNSITYDNRHFKIKGFIGSVKTPSELKDKENNVSNNAITILSNGRIFQENILEELDNAKIFTSYLVGEINADFLDATEFKDMAISSRQGLRQNDERYQILKMFIADALKKIDSNWDEWRKEKGIKEIKQAHPKVKDWLEGFNDNRDKEAAQKLLGKINTIRFSGNKDEQEKNKKEILKNAILGFEKLRIKGNLDRLDDMTHFTAELFKPILNSIDDIEESYFYDITVQRISIIKKLEELTDENEKERVIQKYLYNHLWLFDPAWERTTSETEIERDLTKEIKEIDPESKGARIDIAYKTISGKYIIIEMKKPDVRTSFDDLIEQGKKYYRAARRWYEKHPQHQLNGEIPMIEIYFIVGKKGADKIREAINTDGRESVVNALKSIKGQYFTYNDLITQSRRLYSDYIEKQKDIKRIKDIIDNI